MKLITTGTTPSKKNSRIINRRTGRSFPSKRYSDWHKVAVIELKQQFAGLCIKDYPIELVVVFYNDNNLRHDIDNALSSVLDTLVDAGILEDDNQKYVNKITVSYGGIDKAHPRCEIFIED